ncbi:hypothetical protein B0T22DRAFT_290194 [Podospora appendiculata]|uniref:HECT-type E3 ubiquitin transferase n=1 Tax=Podospora appendiculata TaxID=314037 RepID=A0AAE1C8C6_9PEZI|nr:hypothetical protein B0T22DRAFT_290194 [Podospora appendiculata]
MTGETPRAADGGHGNGHGSSGSGSNANNISEIDVLAGLWEQAPFARLPPDAPNELRDFLEYIDNPKRVYSVHKASRRHNFQQLVQKFIVQLREGCGSDHCSTSSCFTCRKRIVGRAPIRRYNTTSARTLATYLATQDNAENGLCPGLRTPKGPPAALKILAFVPSPKPPLASPKGQVLSSHGNSPKGSPSRSGTPKASSSRSGSIDGSPGKARKLPSPAPDDHTQKASQRPGFTIVEEPTSKDHRSFAANVFATVAFKMLEWLTPASIEELSRRAQSFQGLLDTGSTTAVDDGQTPTPKSNQDVSAAYVEVEADGPLEYTGPIEGRQPEQEIERKEGNGKDGTKKDQHQLATSPAPRPGAKRRNSNTKVRTASGTKPKHQLSIDPFTSETLSEDPYSGLLKSPRANGCHSDRTSRGPKTTSSTLSRPISQLSSAGFFDDVRLEKMPPQRRTELRTKSGLAQLDGARSSESNGLKEPAVESGGSSSRSCSNASAHVGDPDSDQEDESQLPQTLSRLNPELVDFICDVIHQDHTAEKHLLEPPAIATSMTKLDERIGGRILRRNSRHGVARPGALRLEWKLFVEQTLFYVLSDPRLALRSFAKKGQLYDSQTLWYCMLRMTRVAPSLVFHSLWMAAASLFSPPKSLQSLRSPTSKLFPRHEESLSNAEAGRLVSICLHALIAAAPLLATVPQLTDMSRIRAHGLSLGSPSVATQPSHICLAYEDCFTNDLALRLARRLFAAIVARRYYDEINESRTIIDEDNEPDVLAPLFSQLDFLNLDPVYILDFSFPDRAIHEARVPILLLDWARAVMLTDWDGNPEVPGNGSFGGALALIEALHKRRHELLLADGQFRAEYFADRLDSVTMPAAWLSHDRTRERLHLLDFSFMFSPSALVSYFRAINFSRMSRAYEDSASLGEQMDEVSVRSTLDRRFKDVLTRRLKLASTKYLILEVRRKHIIQDAFDQLWRREERELLRPLKVRLGEASGELGFDSGGVSQEFFRLAAAELLNPDYGIFTVDSRTQMAWFVPGSMEPEWKLELAGLLVSLAVYNGLTLPITFPKALYRKLLGEPVTELHHIADGWVDLARGLTQLLEWDEKEGLVEDVICRTYQFSVTVYGEQITRNMLPPSTDSPKTSSYGATKDEPWPQFPQTAAQASATPAPQTGNASDDNAPLVTSANRGAYVEDYIRYLTSVSVEPQYSAFARGFHRCQHPKALSLLTPPLLQSIVEGVQEIDIAELKRYTRYVGWDVNHHTVRDFWSIVRKFDDETKRRLLEFVTASDRVPVGGMEKILFVLQKNGDDDTRLPTSYTCYGILLLPEYSDKETLKERLSYSLGNGYGFGFA